MTASGLEAVAWKRDDGSRFNQDREDVRDYTPAITAAQTRSTCSSVR